jgi:hypothetical protein
VVLQGLTVTAPGGGELQRSHAMSARGWHSPVLKNPAGQSWLHVANTVSAVAVQSLLIKSLLIK